MQRILYYIKENACLGRAYKVTDELFDLSTMAMEYFKEHIEPTLPEITFFGADFLDFTTPFTSKYLHDHIFLSKQLRGNKKITRVSLNNK